MKGFKFIGHRRMEHLSRKTWVLPSMAIAFAFALLLLFGRQTASASNYTYNFPLPHDNGQTYAASALNKYSGGKEHSSYINQYMLEIGSNPRNIVVDIAGNNISGKEIRPILDGVVKVNTYGDGGGYYVVIQHPVDGSYSYYGHMREKSKLKIGQSVTTNDVVGYVGKTGGATGPHLHFEWSKHDPYCIFVSDGYITQDILAAPKRPHVHDGDRPSITGATANVTDIGKTSATFHYKIEMNNAIACYVQRVGMVITSSKGKTKIWSEIPNPAKKNRKSNTLSGDKTNGDMGITLEEGESYAFTFFIQYGYKDRSVTLKCASGSFITLGQQQIDLVTHGNGEWFTVTKKKAKIKEDPVTLLAETLYTPDLGQTFEVVEHIQSLIGEWVKVRYSGSKQGFIETRFGTIQTPYKKSVISVNSSCHGVPIHNNYYGSADLISSRPSCLHVGASVYVLGEYKNKYDNIWYYVQDAYGHNGWVWSEYFKEQPSVLGVSMEADGVRYLAIECPEPGENSLADIYLPLYDAVSETLSKLASGNGGSIGGSTGGGTTKKKTVAFTGLKFQFNSPQVFDTNAVISGYAVPYGYPNVVGKWTQTGVRVWDNETGEAVPLHGSTVDEKHNYSLTRLKISYNITSELGATLEPGTTYRYQFYTVCNGQTFWSDPQYFTTTGYRKCAVHFDSDGGTAVADAEFRYGKTMPLPQPVRSEVQHGVTINYVFRGWYTDAARTVPFTDTSKVKGDMTLYAKWELEKPIVDVTAITLDKTSGAIFANSDEDLMTIVPIIQPAEATFTDILWTTSDPEIANTDQYGHIVAIGPGTATITCASVANPQVKATCTVTVKQRMDWLYLEQDDFALYIEDTFNLTAGFLPANATETAIRWMSSDPSVATVNESGVVTAVAPGTAVITVTSQDKPELTASCAVTVESELALNLNQIGTTFYREGEQDNTIAFIYPSDGSMMRALRDDWSWQVFAEGTAADIAWEEVDFSTYNENEGTIYGYGLYVHTTALNAAGTVTVTVTCENGDNTATVSFDIIVSDLSGVLAREVTLPVTAYTGQIGDALVIPSTPVAADGGSLPEDLTLSLDASAALCRTTAIEETAQGITVAFSESGIYSANAVYSVGNIRYVVPLTFTISDENGDVHLPVTNISLDMESCSILNGNGVQLTATVGPEEAWNKAVTWYSSNEQVATVDENGMVTGVSVGSAVITARPADGSEVSASTVIRVESYLQLESNELQVPVYISGTGSDELAAVSLTLTSYARLIASEDDITWEITRLSENAPSTVIALDERKGYAVLRLLRVNGAGTDLYRVTCRSGQCEGHCDVKVNVYDDALPASVSVANTAITGSVGAPVTIDATPVSSPALPNGTWIMLTGSEAMMTAVSDLEYDGTTITATFDKPAVFQAKLVYYGPNYTFDVPVTITIRDAQGNAPVMADSLELDRTALFLSSGQTASLTATLLPANATDRSIVWTSDNEEVATVSATGEITAVDVGKAIITAMNETSGLTASCLVTVENELTLAGDSVELDAYVEGAGRLPVASVYLTEASSMRLTEAPEWTLKRLRGNNLTLKVNPTTSINAEGHTLYGAEIELYSISTIGDTEYELTCQSGDESASLEVLVHGKSRSDDLPASVTLVTDTYTAAVGELIEFVPDYVCAPADAALPANLTAAWSYDTAFAEALNPEDCFVNRGISTFSFSEPGRFEAELVLSAANLRYTIPVTFRITASDGSVPVNGQRVHLDRETLDLEAGESAQLTPVFTPEDVTNRQVTWTSSDTSVAAVNAEGLVTAMANGTATITCVPSDEHMSPVTCTVRVENYLSAASGATRYNWYLQGKPENAAGALLLTAGSVQRMARDGLEPEWTLTRDSGACAEITMKTLAGNAGVNLITTALNAAGTDTYTLTCTAGSHIISRQFTLNVLDLGVAAPRSVSISRDQVSVAVGEAATIDFTPVCAPDNTSIPSGMSRYYVGFGSFYDALDYDNSSLDDDSDQVVVAFEKAGVYLLSRYYTTRNLSYVSTCKITVGEPEETSAGLLKATETDCTVYLGGTSGVISTVSVEDSSALTIWGDRIEWRAEKVSGDNIVVSLEADGSKASLFVADAPEEGVAVWRVSCALGDVVESVDITITTRYPFYAIPSGIRLAVDRLAGMTGETMALPLGAICEPAGTRLPETGDGYWRMELDGNAASRCAWKIQGGLLKTVFTQSGYYTGRIVYETGNVSYSVPVYFTVWDEENVTPEPDLDFNIVDAVPVVYPEGETGVSVGVALVSDGLSVYSAGTAPSYMTAHEAVWNVTTDSDAVSLSLAPATANARTLMLDGISGRGDVGYTVTCEVNGHTLSASGTIHIASDDEPRPDATLRHSTYYAHVGDTVTINRKLYSREDGSLLQASTSWNASALLAAIGYQFETTADEWTATFYTNGTFTSSVTGYIGNLRVESPLSVIVTASGQAIDLPVLRLPAALTTIESEAFEGSAAAVVDLRGTRVSAIGSGAFRHCVDLQKVYLPGTVIDIADDAFYGCINVVFVCEDGSPADRYAAAHGIPTANE